MRMKGLSDENQKKLVRILILPLAEQFSTILKKADEDDHRRSGKANKKSRFE